MCCVHRLKSQPQADVPCDQKRRYLRVLFFDFDENKFKRFVTQVLWQVLSRITPQSGTGFASCFR